MNVALPSIRRDLGFSAQGLQWVLSGYLVTYGGLLLLGGRAGDLLGRRPLLVAGTALFAACSLAGGLAGDLVHLGIAEGHVADVAERGRRRWPAEIGEDPCRAGRADTVNVHQV